MTEQMNQDPISWVAGLEKPHWDTYFMALTFMAAMRSPDQQTKQGAVIVDWNTKSIIGMGYNGHPRGVSGLPTMRYGTVLTKEPLITRTGTFGYGHTVKDYDTFPAEERLSLEQGNLVQGKPDKYKFMCHCETNALLGNKPETDNAVLYVPMPSCEACATLMLNHPTVKLTRVVFYEKRDLDQTLYIKKGVKLDHYADLNLPDPVDLFNTTIGYLTLRRTQSDKLSAASAKTYR